MDREAIRGSGGATPSNFNTIEDSFGVIILLIYLGHFAGGSGGYRIPLSLGEGGPGGPPSKNCEPLTLFERIFRRP